MNERINLQDLAALLAEKASISKKDADTFLREYFDVLNEELVKTGLVKIKDLGVFKLVSVEDRESVDVTTGERVLIRAHYKVTFTPDKKLAETVNEPFAFFEAIEIEDESGLEELKSFPDEEDSDDSDESEPTPAVEEETVDAIVEEPTSVEEDDFDEPAIEEEDSPLVESTSVAEPASVASKEVRNYCLNCHDYEAHHAYRKKYFASRKKILQQQTTIWILSVLLFIALCCIAYLLPIDKLISFKEFSPAAVISESMPKKDTALITPKTPNDAIVPVEKASANSKQMTIAQGDRLTSIALKEYGDKAFWIYIYIENKAIISNPEVLPVGVTISIPPAEKYGIDCNDSVSIRKAKDAAAKRP